MAALSAPNDRIYRSTRWLAVIIVPFLIAASIILYVFPDRTGELFAWPIQPPLTAMMLGAAYVGGVYFFTRAALAGQWSAVKAGFPPVTLFASLLGVATIVHWNRFTHDHISFVVWAGLYFTTPFLVSGAWLLNRRTDPHTPAAQDAIIPAALRWALGLVGAVTLAISLLLFLQPQAMIGVWPWKLTPLTARVVGAMFALPGLVGLGLALDRRWSAARIILQAQAVSIGFILIAAVRAWTDFDAGNPGTWLFLGGLTGLLLGIVALYAFMEAERGPA